MTSRRSLGVYMYFKSLGTALEGRGRIKERRKEGGREGEKKERGGGAGE